MNRKALVVFTYAGQQEMVNRHHAYFERGGSDIIYIYPKDATLLAPKGVTGIAIGKSEHYGSELMQRMGIGIGLVAAMNYDTIAVVEGDSIVLRPIPDAQPSGIDCFLYDTNGDPQWKAKHYVHWPWLMSGATAYLVGRGLQAMVEAGDIERGFPDRMLGLCAERLDIELRHRPDLTYSRNRVDAPEYIQQARTAIASGAVFVHGLKTQLDIDAILK